MKHHLSRRIALGGGLSLGLLLCSCNIGGGYSDLAQLFDPLVAIDGEDHTTWIRDTDDATEILLLGGIQKSGKNRYVFSIFEHEDPWRAKIWAGTYELNEESGTLNFHALDYYKNNYSDAEKPLNRPGAQHESVSEKSQYRYELDAENEELALELEPASGEEVDKEELKMRSFVTTQRMFESVELQTKAGAETLLKFFHLGIVSSQTRFKGFGGASLATQGNMHISIRGAISGEMDVYVDTGFETITEVTYKNFSDYTGFVINGLQSTSVDIDGDGQMYDSLDFSLDLNPRKPEQMETEMEDSEESKPITGSVSYGKANDYANSIQLKRGAVAGGAYGFSYEDGESWNLSWQTFVDRDFSDLLP